MGGMGLGWVMVREDGVMNDEYGIMRDERRVGGGGIWSCGGMGGVRGVRVGV